MKVDKIISIAVINGLTLLLFASLLAGCQKTSIHHAGLFTKYTQQNSRTIASATISSDLEKHFDVKQVYIFCKVNDINVEQCFKKNFEVILKRYEDKNGSLAQGQKDELIRQVNFNQIKTNTEVIAKSMIDKMSTHIGQLVSKRESFCRVNSKFYIKRCLGQYVEKDTMSVLNAYQGHNREMNGHEYLYLKNKIKEKFNTSLAVSLDKLQSEEKKS